MTRLVFVHGINQQARSEDSIRDECLTALRSEGGRGDSWPGTAVSEVRAPFYGDRLFALTETKPDVQAIAQGAEEPADDFAEFADAAIEQMARRIAPDAPEWQSGAPVPQGAGAHKRSVKAIVRLLERVSPWHGEIALGLLAQAHAYLMRPNVGDEIDDIVRPILRSDEPTIVVAHSLGTIVAYKLLREFEQNGSSGPAPLLVTLGSPLGIDVIRKRFAVPRKKPAQVERWFNGADPADFVALQPILDKKSFGSGIENIDAIANGYDNPHSIVDYLQHHRVGALIAAGLIGALPPIAQE